MGISDSIELAVSSELKNPVFKCTSRDKYLKSTHSKQFYQA